MRAAPRTLAALPTTVDENATGKIGGAFTATDADGDTITWSVGGTDASSFDISDISGGQLSLASGSTLDYETQSSYSVTVTASDGTGSDSVAVTVTLTDVDEQPPAPPDPGSSPNNPPVIGGGATVTITVKENATGSIGSAFTATDADGDTITWSVGGTGASSFNISGGQLSLASGATLDYETKASYSITVIASDGTGSDSVAVTVRVTDVREPPGRPAAPTVAANSTTSLTVTWGAPTNTGPPITRYYIHYCLDSTGCDQNSEWSSNPSTANTTATIADLREGETYQVRVRAKSNEGQSPWSAIGTGATSTAN